MVKAPNPYVPRHIYVISTSRPIVHLETESVGLDGIIGLLPGCWPSNLTECPSSSAGLATLDEGFAFDGAASSSSCGTLDDDPVVAAALFSDVRNSEDPQYKSQCVATINIAGWTSEFLHSEDLGNGFQATLFFSAGVVGLSPGCFPFLDTMTSPEPYRDSTAASCAANDTAAATCSAEPTAVRLVPDSMDGAGEGLDLERTPPATSTPNDDATGDSFTAAQPTCLPYLLGSGVGDFEVRGDVVISSRMPRLALFQARAVRSCWFVCAFVASIVRPTVRSFGRSAVRSV